MKTGSKLLVEMILKKALSRIPKNSTEHIQEHMDEITDLVWKGFIVSKHIATLTKKTNYILSLSVFDLTIKNLGGES